MTLRMALAQINARLGATADNMAEVARLSDEAGRQGARLVVFPEGCLTGNALKDPAKQAVLPCREEAFEPLAAVARARGITICAGFATPFEGKFNIVQCFVTPRAGVVFQRKSSRAPTEPTFLAPWPDPARSVVDVAGVRVVVMICSEYGHKPAIAAMAAARPQLVLHPSAGSMKEAEVLRDGAPPSEAALAFDANCRTVVDRAAERVREEGVPRAGANPSGFDGETWWPGNSYAVDAGGRVALWLKGENRPARMGSSLGIVDMPVAG